MPGIPGGASPNQVGQFYVPFEDFTAPIALTPSTGALVLTGFAPSLQVPRTIVPGVGALTMAGLAPALKLPRLRVAGVGSLGLAGFAPIVTASVATVVVGPYVHRTPHFIPRHVGRKRKRECDQLVADLCAHDIQEAEDALIVELLLAGVL